MSLEDKRQEFADALSTVGDVTGFPYRPATPRAGDAWPLLSSMERGPGSTFEDTWRVRVFLPQDERLASQWIDSHAEALFVAVNPVAFIERFEPVTLTAGTTSQFALEITCRSE